MDLKTLRVIVLMTLTDASPLKANPVAAQQLSDEDAVNVKRRLTNGVHHQQKL